MSLSESSSSAPGRAASFAVEAVKQYGDLLRSYLARHLRRPHDVDDLSQQVYLRLIRMRTSPNEIQEPVAFVYSVARKVLADHWIAQRKRDKSFPSVGDAAEVCANLPSEDLHDNLEEALGLQQQLVEHLKKLPPMHAACMVLFHRDQLSQKEVAQKLGLQPDTVKTYLTDGRARLRKLLATESDQG